MEALNFNLTLNNPKPLYSKAFQMLEPLDFIKFSIDYVARCKQRSSDLPAYRSLLKHLSNFTTVYGSIIMSNELGKETIDEFIHYLHIDVKLKRSTIQGLILKLKHLLNKVYRSGYAVDHSYDDVKIHSEDLFFIYLDERDISRIYYYDNLTKAEQEVRDLFIIGCKTGLRYSDYSRLKPENIKGNIIQIKTRKTRANACVPVTKYVHEILIKYDNHIPPARCIQYFNKAIKEVCRKVGMTEIISYEREIGGEIMMIQKPKYELISSHTARRTFITNNIKDGTAESNIMKLTGHKSSQCLARYNRMTTEENALALLGTGYFS